MEVTLISEGIGLGGTRWASKVVMKCQREEVFRNAICVNAGGMHT